MSIYSNCASFMHKPLGFHVGIASLYRAGESSKMNSSSKMAYGRFPLTAKNSNTQKTGGVIGSGTPPVLHVYARGNVAQIAKSIVSRVCVYVVNL